MSPRESTIGIAAGLFYRSNGAGDGAADIWLIHGFAESSFCFRHVLEADGLAGYRLHAVDLPGFGVSPTQPGCATPADRAATARASASAMSASVAQPGCVGETPKPGRSTACSR